MSIEEIQNELQVEIDLCNKYFIEEDLHKNSTEHERLALHIVTMCMQTLSALKEGELEELKVIKSDGFTDSLLNMGYTKAINDLTNNLISYFSEHAYEVWNHVSARDFICDNIETIAEKMKSGETQCHARKREYKLDRF